MSGEQKPVQEDFQVVIKAPQTLDDTHVVWFDIYKGEVRVNTISPKRSGVPLVKSELLELRRFVDYLLENPNWTAAGAVAAIHPEHEEEKT